MARNNVMKMASRDPKYKRLKAKEKLVSREKSKAWDDAIRKAKKEIAKKNKKTTRKSKSATKSRRRRRY